MPPFRPVRLGARLCLAALAGAWLAAGVRAEPGPGLSEYELKAAFIYNFAKFTEWPGEGAAASFRFCVAGRDPFGEALDKLAERTVRNHPIAVFRGVEPDEAADCELLFLHGGDAAHRAAALKHVAGRPVLTVGDDPGFIEGGGMIELMMVENRVQFEVNLLAVKSAKLMISAQLLRLARRVKGAD
jgi:hypothetical protein